jgi:hypothetical protein
MTGPMGPDPRFHAWLSQHAPSGASRDLLERSMRQIDATAQSPMHRPRWLIAGLSGTSVAVLAVVLTFLASRPSPLPDVGPAASRPVASQRETPPTRAATASPAPTPQPAEVLARIRLPHPDPQTAFLDQIAVIDDTIWTAGVRGQELIQIDGRHDRIVSTAAVPPSSLIVGDGGQLWTVSPVGVAPGPANLDVSRVDHKSGVPQKVTEVPATNALAVGFGKIWTPHVGSGLAVWNAKTGERVATLGALHADGLTIACGSLWIWQFAADGVGWGLDRVDPASGAVLDHFELPDGTNQRLVDIGGTCWTDDGVNIYGVAGGQPLIETAVQAPGRVHLTGDSAWVLYANVVRRIDPRTGGAIGPSWKLPEQDVRIEVPKVGADWHLLSADGSLWLLRNDEIVRYAIPSS